MDNIWPEVFMIESAAIVVGNLLTIVVLSNRRFLKKKGNWLILNLAVADFLVGAVSEPLYIATIKGLKVAVVYTTFDILLGMASVLGLAVLAVDRVFAISWPFRHRTVSTKPYTWSIIGVWLTAATVAVVSFFLSSDRSAVLYYVLLPLLTFAQLVMIVSYVAIWIIVTTKRPKAIKKQRNGCAKSEVSSDDEESLSGSVRYICSDFNYDCDDPIPSVCETGSITISHDNPCEHSTSTRESALQEAGKKAVSSLINYTSNKHAARVNTRSFRTLSKSFIVQRGQLMSIRNLKHLKNRVKQRQESIDRDKKLALTLFLVTAISLLAWLPFEIMNIVMSACPPCRVKLYNIHVLSLTKLLHYANSLVNPIIYTFRITEFRRSINSILTLQFMRKKHRRTRSTFTYGTSGYSLRTKSFYRTTDL